MAVREDLIFWEETICYTREDECNGSKRQDAMQMRDDVFYQGRRD